MTIRFSLGSFAQDEAFLEKYFSRTLLRKWKSFFRGPLLSAPVCFRLKAGRE
jgi:hypothetical protein